jgi:hypothetical protein
MTVHSPPSTSLGTRRSDDDKGVDFLEVIQVLLGISWRSTAPQAQVLGQGEVISTPDVSFG